MTTIETLREARALLDSYQDDYGGGVVVTVCIRDLDALIAQGDDLPDEPLFIRNYRTVQNGKTTALNDAIIYIDKLRSHAQALAARLAGLEQGG